ncbi:MAG: hypothetical protein LBJ69_03025 [Holosporales bacterium]|jgi:hypothetical protein|nr:hypothetical protein [Holosporales bacterium]
MVKSGMKYALLIIAIETTAAGSRPTSEDTSTNPPAQHAADEVAYLEKLGEKGQELYQLTREVRDTISLISKINMAEWNNPSENPAQTATSLARRAGDRSAEVLKRCERMNPNVAKPLLKQCCVQLGRVAHAMMLKSEELIGIRQYASAKDQTQLQHCIDELRAGFRLLRRAARAARLLYEECEEMTAPAGTDPHEIRQINELVRDHRGTLDIWRRGGIENQRLDGTEYRAKLSMLLREYRFEMEHPATGERLKEILHNLNLIIEQARIQTLAGAAAPLQNSIANIGYEPWPNAEIVPNERSIPDETLPTCDQVLDIIERMTDIVRTPDPPQEDEASPE